MAVFTALRNQARSTIISAASGLVNSALGTGRGSPTNPSPSSPFSQSDVGLKLRNATGGRSDVGSKILQYPLDLTTDDQPHYILFVLKERQGKNKVSVGNSSKRIPSPKAAASAGGAGEVSKEARITKAIERANQAVQASDSPAKSPEFRSAGSVGGPAGGRVLNTGGKSFQQSSFGVLKTKAAIAMYFPPSVQHTYSLRYNEEEIGTLALAGASVIEEFIRQGFGFRAFQEIANNPDFAGSITEGLNRKGIQMVNAAAPGAQALFEINRGKIFAPKMEVMFDNINRRKFAYSFVMNPTSESEAIEIHKIVQAFRHHAAADYLDSQFTIEIPQTFQIEYYCGATVQNNFITKTEECFLETIDVTYGGDKMHFHEPSFGGQDFLGNSIAGAPPTRTTMTLNFVELPIITKSKIAEGF